MASARGNHIDMRILITGITGFIGFHLAQELACESHEIHGIARRLPPDGTREELPAGAILHRCDITHGHPLATLLRAVGPDCIYHLAGLSSMAEAWRNPHAAFQTNVMGTVALLEAALSLGRPVPVLISGSGHQYGLVRDEELPIVEATPLRPVSPYGSSKAAQELAALQYFRSDRLPVLIARTFNPVGPRQPETFVCSRLVKELVEKANGKRPVVLTTGSLDSVRDFLDVRDVARAYKFIVERGQPGEAYNVCSGRGLSPRQILELLQATSGVTYESRIAHDTVRRAEVPVLVGSNQKISSTLGWRREISLERSLSDLWKYWLSQVEETKHKKFRFVGA